MHATSRRSLAAAILLAVATAAPLLSGCSTNPATGEQSFTAFMSPEQERQVGREQDPLIKQEFGGAYDDAELAAYVTRIGNKLAATSEMPDLDFRFTVLNTPDVNAFALPGGYVYITRGLVALAENEAELAGVIAHEIGHVTARHSAERYSRGTVIGLGAAILGVLSENQAIADLANLGSQLYLKSYSRDQEFQADTLGIRYLSRAGYETGAMASFLKKLGSASRLQAEIAGGNHDPDAVDLMATHPRTVDRVQKALVAASVRPVSNPIVGRDPFLDKVDGVLFGSDPKEGMIRDRVFLHKDLNFRFEVPPNFRIYNQPDRVLAADQNGARFIFDAAPKASGQIPARYIRDSWAKGHAVRDLESITINGMNAATGWLAITANNRTTYMLRLVAIRYNADTLYRMQFLIPSWNADALNEGMRRTTYSFRRLSADEQADIRPYRVKVMRFDGTVSEQSLAGSIPFPGYELRYFRVINGLENGQQPPSGSRVKTIRPD
ncbi:M48 family metalloprotease [Nisaea nitritireducens]|uniref:M48 family metalloprotease n=1 Tax=Nisaea nitritireducens TaxID=568392 RepID=UPI0018695265|nr:M48 family metalloprotease [Nisaea nitritireducens]